MHCESTISADSQHIAQLLTASYPLDKIQPVIEAYFPSLPSDNRDQVDAKPKTTASLYIKSMTSDERRSWYERKKAVERMVKLKQSVKATLLNLSAANLSRAGKAFSASEGTVELDVSQIVGIALRACLVIQEDTAAMEAAFPSPAPKASRRATAGPSELKLDRPPKMARRSLPG